jgi:hypothetical protein
MWAALACPEDADPSHRARERRRKKRRKTMEPKRTKQQIAIETQVIMNQNRLIKELHRDTKDRWLWRHRGAAGLRGRKAEIRPYLWVEFERSTRRLQRANSNLGEDFTGPDPGTYTQPQFPGPHPSSTVRVDKYPGAPRARRGMRCAQERGTKCGEQLFTYEGTWQRFGPGPNCAPAKPSIGPQHLSRHANAPAARIRGKGRREPVCPKYSKTNYRCEPSSLFGPQLLSNFPSAPKLSMASAVPSGSVFGGTSGMENVPYTYAKETTNPNVKQRVPAALFDPNEHGIGGHAFAFSKEVRGMNKPVNPRYVYDAAVGTYNLQSSVGRQVLDHRRTAQSAAFSKSERPMNDPRTNKTDGPGPAGYRPAADAGKPEPTCARLVGRPHNVPAGHKLLHRMTQYKPRSAAEMDQLRQRRTGF